MMQEISPQLTILEALQTQSPDSEDLSKLIPSLYFSEKGQSFVLTPQDLNKMHTMGLSHLPVDSIAIPTDSLLQKNQGPLVRKTMDISHGLTRHFPGHFVAALYELQSILNKNQMKAFLIGGIVRDILLSQERLFTLADVDITVVGDALAFSELVTSQSKNFTVKERFPNFGTAIIQYKDSIYIDVASTRKEVYPHCGALPEVFERGVSLQEDVVRRDFTVNALALSIHQLGQVVDYTSGIEDIEAREIRVLHPVSFFEDPSRILRALKFCARLDFNLSIGTQRLLEKFITYGQSVYKGGGERIKEELQEFLHEADTPTIEKWLEYFEETQCLKITHMSLSPKSLGPKKNRGNFKSQYDYWKGVKESLSTIEGQLHQACQISSEETTPHYYSDIYLCLLLQEVEAADLQKVEQRLGLTKSERDTLFHFRNLCQTWSSEDQSGKSLFNLDASSFDASCSPVEIYQLFQPISHTSAVAGLIALHQSQGNTALKKCLQAFIYYKTQLKSLKPNLDGHDLIDLGIPEGVAIGTVLKKLLHVKLKGLVTNRLEEVLYVKKLQEDPGFLDSDIETLFIREESAHDRTGD
jgi:tRNA nucleotidyltransferase/poly(A) polymerase